MENTADMGRRIRELRLQRNMTQDKLAAELMLTPQAVSKWENGAGLPDVTLLPKLSVALGVTIDELFALTDAARLERIDRMMTGEAFLSQRDFEDAERFLKRVLDERPEDGEAALMLADLYLHRSESFRDLSASYAKRALELIPETKHAHSVLSMASNGKIWDWCCANHHEYIDYYYDFIRKNPNYSRGYLWLLDNLLDDNRLDEAERAVCDMEALRYTYHVPLYRGWIAAQRGDVKKAEELWRRMSEEFPEEWKVWSSLGDAMAKLTRYDEAVEYYGKAAKMEEPPRYTDNFMSIAQIREIQGRFSEAADAYEKVLEIMREDWGLTEGAYVEKMHTALERCRNIQ